MKELDYELVIKYVEGSCSPEEKLMVEESVSQDESLRKEVAVLQKVWAVNENHLPAPDVEGALQKVKERIDIDKNSGNVYNISTGENIGYISRVKRSGIFKIAAVLVLSITVLMTYFSLSSVKEIELLVPNGKTQVVNFSDGTKVTLDSGSRLKYPEEFAGNTREVILDGEAFFDVTSNPEQPFIVKTTKATVQVLGTEFNLRSWSSSEEATLAVFDGKVLFSNKTLNKKPVLVKRGEVSAFIGTNLPLAPVTSEVDEYLLWQKREMHFRNNRLEEVLQQLERWYGLSFKLSDNKYLNNKVSIFLKDEGVDNIVNLISAVMNFDYSIKGLQVEFTLR